LAHRRGAHGLEVLLVHPGGPFWRNKDEGAWSIPEGELDPSEHPEEAARREFTEELGPAALIKTLQSLGEVRQRRGERVIAFGGEATFDPATLSSNSFEIDWPPKSGRRQSFPKLIAPHGSTCRPRNRRCCPAKSSSLIGWRRCWPHDPTEKAAKIECQTRRDSGHAPCPDGPPRSLASESLSVPASKDPPPRLV
jgi:predicted NUDIX family NTP pyrophosphohydrolase